MIPRTRKPLSAEPVVKWAGGKRQLLDELVRLLPKDYEQRRHVELFAGGAALFFDRAPASAVLADSCQPLMCMYAAISEAPASVLLKLQRMTRSHGPDYYYRVRERFNGWNDRAAAVRNLADSKALQARVAAEMLYLNRAGFNGLFRCNQAGNFNVPWGQRTKQSIYQPELVHAASPLLRRATLACADFRSASLSGAGFAVDDFVYLDPPYTPSCGCAGRAPSFQAYGSDGFNHEDHLELRDLAERMEQFGARIMVSNADTPFVRDIWRRWNITAVKARRSIGADGARRANVRELVIRSYT